jgi:hypothetical protein
VGWTGLKQNDDQDAQINYVESITRGAKEFIFVVDGRRLAWVKIISFIFDSAFQFFSSLPSGMEATCLFFLFLFPRRFKPHVCCSGSCLGLYEMPNKSSRSSFYSFSTPKKKPWREVVDLRVLQSTDRYSY